MRNAVKHEPFVAENDILLINEWARTFGVYAGFSTKKGGVSKGPFTSMNLAYTVGDEVTDVLTNRRMLAAKTPIPYERWIFAHQQHTSHVAEVTSAHIGAGGLSVDTAISNTDGMYTFEKGLMLATFHADCTPVYFYSPPDGLIGMVHAGWQGTVKGITRVLIDAWVQKGVDPANIYIVLGPAASQTLYEVDERVVTQIRQMKLMRAGEAIVAHGNGKYLLDTAYLNYLVAIDAGVRTEHIMRSTYCTIKESDMFFSYRRSGQTGRMLAFISQ